MCSHHILKTAQIKVESIRPQEGRKRLGAAPMLPGLVVNAFQLKRAAVVVDEIINGQDLAVG
jgi:hypothetical protein